MSARTATRLAWSLWGVAAALTLVALAFLVINGSTEHPNSVGSSGLDAALLLVFLTFPTVGALIAASRPQNAIGWIFLGAGIGAAMEDAALGYATYTLVSEPGSLPGGAAAALVADVVWVPTLTLSTTLLFLLFPGGRLPSRRWKPVVYLAVAITVGYAAGTLFIPAPLYFFPDVANPLGINGAEVVLKPVLDATSGPAILCSVALAVVALVLRFRRSQGDERAQMKWLAYTGALLVLFTPAAVILGSRDVQVAGVFVSDVLFTLIVGLIPVAVGVAILRHRLYDIDVVINRTLVYGALTATLIAAYLAGVLLLQLALSPLTTQSDLAVAGSTLAVAALFRPLRTRIQALVDRRFYRRRYDAQRTLAGFGTRLRDEVELENVSADLRAVVAETVQPAHVSLWLRGPAA
jgi:hypothetical protein